MRRGAALGLLLAALCGAASGGDRVGEAATAPAEAARQGVFLRAAEDGEGLWKKVQNPPGDLDSRGLFRYALALCEAGRHPDRLVRLFETAAKMQVRDPQDRAYGNFRWYWREEKVKDYNAVDFCMMGGSLMWIRHRDAMPEEARQKLREILDFAVEGCLRHRVASSYTNIALMNAMDLILLGEGMDRPDVAKEGYARLERALIYTWQWGTHEYCSPTYYGVDLECLVLIEAFCGRENGRRQAQALLELLWTDVAANWYDPAGRVGGARSRDYRYLHGTGPLDTSMRQASWCGTASACGNGRTSRRRRTPRGSGGSTGG